MTLEEALSKIEQLEKELAKEKQKVVELRNELETTKENQQTQQDKTISFFRK